MSKNTGIPYELLTQNIFDQIVNQDSVTTVKIEHDVVLEGKTTSHQIDVFWEFKSGGITYKTVVQAKDWNSTVDQGELLKFNQVLADLPGQPRGVFVTRTGYQSGAKEFADAHGIMLYELREPSEEDMEGWLRRIRLDLITLAFETKSLRVVADQDWIDQEKSRLQLSQSIPIHIEGHDDEIMVYNDDGSLVGSFADITATYYDNIDDELPPKQITHEFEEPVFLHTDVPQFPRMKLSRLEFTIAAHKHTTELVLDAEDIVGFILRNLTDGTETTFDKDRKLRL
jgi:hypothetical protein